MLYTAASSRCCCCFCSRCLFLSDSVAQKKIIVLLKVWTTKLETQWDRWLTYCLTFCAIVETCYVNQALKFDPFTLFTICDWWLATSETMIFVPPWTCEQILHHWMNVASNTPPADLQFRAAIATFPLCSSVHLAGPGFRPDWASI